MSNDKHSGGVAFCMTSVCRYEQFVVRLASSSPISHGAQKIRNSSTNVFNSYRRVMCYEYGCRCQHCTTCLMPFQQGEWSFLKLFVDFLAFIWLSFYTISGLTLRDLCPSWSDLVDDESNHTWWRQGRPYVSTLSASSFPDTVALGRMFCLIFTFGSVPLDHSLRSIAYNN